ncbi:bck1-like resistance to osmotic shock, partial [Coemansia sp. RSA 1804]
SAGQQQESIRYSNKFLTMSRPPCIAIAFKKTAEADWVRPLRQYIIKVFQEDPDVYNSDCQLLQRMRQDMR